MPVASVDAILGAPKVSRTSTWDVTPFFNDKVTLPWVSGELSELCVLYLGFVDAHPISNVVATVMKAACKNTISILFTKSVVVKANELRFNDNYNTEEGETKGSGERKPSHLSMLLSENI